MPQAFIVLTVGWKNFCAISVGTKALGITIADKDAWSSLS